MSGTLTVHLTRPVASIGISGGRPGVGSDSASLGLSQQSEHQKKEFSGLNQALKGLVEKLGKFCETLFAEHKEEIAKLSVEIARKILMQKVQDGDYEIEKIVQEALNNAPTHQDLVVHLNPADLVEYQKLQQDESAEALPGVKFVSDTNIGRGECQLESPKGVIGLLIDENLERIGKALVKAE